MREINWEKVMELEKALEAEGCYIQVMLTVGDVNNPDPDVGLRPDLTDEQAEQVLRKMANNEDWEWQDVVLGWAAAMFPEAK